jgi:hypothetical protein
LDDDKLTKEIWGDMEYDPPGFLFWVVLGLQIQLVKRIS